MVKNRKLALIVVDPQNDFFPGGALGAPKAGQIIKPINNILKEGRKKGWTTFISRELHDPNTKEHFKIHGVHCVKGTPGVEIHPEIDTEGVIFINKGTRPDDHYYSSLPGTNKEGITLEDLLAEYGVVAVMGLVLEFCVGDTAKDIRKSGKVVVIIDDATAALTDKGEEKREELKKLGITILRAKDFLEKYGQKTQ